MSDKLIADINKKIAEKKKLNGPEQKVVKISLPQIDPKFDSGEKEDIYDELRSSLKEQLPEWWSQGKVACVAHSNEYYPDVGSWQQKPSHKQRRFPFIYNCPPPQIWIEEPYHQNPSPGSDSEEYGINIYQLGYGVRIYFNDILKYLTEDDDDYENPKPCPYCGVITELESLWEGVNLNRTNECPNGKDIRAALIIAEIIPNPKGMDPGSSK
ncbi:hypothetical protein RhiirA1_446205 [Rhizophagus irregularis]|uniref:Uncharacterized protein n=1 Tax=Rhizophagus irregularis TaxID=588596 RepID=A0A2N0R266_9GLOM|nr:hypothetical protein RhiirA1_446205 [Rhizophagus irregularis]